MPEMIAPRVLSWATDIDDKTSEQAARSADLPFIFQHVALMPDAHFGYGATVGSVIPTQGAIIPSAVGVDIGCGMIAGELALTADDLPDDLGPLHSAIARAVPAGVGAGHSEAAPIPNLPSTKAEKWWTERLVKKAAQQFGSLGSGNHFIELCLDERDHVWIVLHSGSRGVGNELANIHIDGAKDLMRRYFIDLPDPDLAYLVEGTDEFGNYIRDMLWAQEYAMGSRQRMMRLVRDCVDRFMGRDVDLVDVINCHHNFTEREHHMGQNVWLTRKGAIRARTSDRGVIPGSMGAASFVVSGCGNVASFKSCSHGAGRRLSRGQARRELDEQGLVDAMTGKAWNGDATTLLDEDPRAYKDIDAVMAAQADLVTIEHKLRQVLNYKGTS
jgi:tRNA-splicing ligase RtcB (3'-phosphate/5'-hydroxy nucleic acid ligase)